MKEFRFEDYTSDKGMFVMWCKTREEAKEFCELMDRHGKTWCNGISYLTHDGWEHCGEDICYDFNADMYSRKKYYEDVAIVLEWSDFSPSKVIDKEQQLKNLIDNIISSSSESIYDEVVSIIESKLNEANDEVVKLNDKSKEVDINKLYEICNKKDIIFLDLDDVVFNSTAVIVDLLNARYGKSVDYKEITKWDYSCHFDVDIDEIESLYCSQEFFDNVFIPRLNASMLIEKYKDKIKFVTKGHKINLLRKQIFLEERGMGDILFIGLPLEEDKREYLSKNFSSYDYILIDDCVNNLRDEDILFETNRDAEWQKGWNGLYMKGWN